MENILTTKGDMNPFEASAHPVMRVYCDEEAIVCYERYEASPIRLNAVSPARSRNEALKRCIGLIAAVPEHSQERMWPISKTGRGLSYEQLKSQTAAACRLSKELEKKRELEFADKKRKRRKG